MALPDFRINPYVKPYAGGIQKELSEAVTQRRQEYDVASEVADILGYQTDTLIQNISPFEPDALYAKELMGKYRQEIDQWSDRGDYENLGREVKRSAKQFEREATPLLIRKKAYQDYKTNLQESYQKGEIDLEMYQSALNKAVSDNSNMTREQVLQGQFTGFSPTKKIDISKMLDDSIKGMESQGKIGKIQTNADGTYQIVGGEYRSAEDIYNAALANLQGSSDYRNYATTLGALGLVDKLNSETSSALEFVQRKYAYNKPTAQQGFLPEWFYDRNTTVSPSISVQDTPSKNVHAKDKYDGLTFKGDKFVYGDYIGNITTPEGVKRGYYINKINGEKISPQTYSSLHQRSILGQMLAGEDKYTNYEFKEASSLEEEKIQNEYIDNLRNDSKKKFLMERSMLPEGSSGKVPTEWLNNPQQYQQQIDDYLRINQNRWNNSQYMQQTLSDYKDAVNNAAIMNNNKVWTPVETRASLKRKGEELNIPNIIRNIAGREVYELGADSKPTRKGKVDISSFLEESQDKGKLKDVTYLGLAQTNALSNKPGQRYDFIYEDSDGKTFKKSVIVPIEDAALQPMQDVMMAAMSGQSTEIKVEDVYIPSTGRYMNLKFDVFSVPNPDKDSRKTTPFVGTVIISDKNGNRTPVDLANFPQFYKSLVPTEVEKYLR